MRDLVQSIALDVRTAMTADVLDLEVRFSTDDAGTFTGHAAIFDEKNDHGEIVRRGAFARSITEHHARASRPPMLWSHRPDEVIGVWTDVREDATGLAVRGKLITEITAGREAYERLKAGAVNGLSIGFRARQQQRGAGGVRILTDIDLVEISLVAMPSAGRARIQHVRCAPSLVDLSAFTRAVARTSAALGKRT